MNKSMSLPQREYNQLKLHALFLFLSGILLVTDPIYNVLNTLFSGQSWILSTMVMVMVYVPLMLYTIYLSFGLWVDGLRIKSLQYKKHNQDEFSVSVKNKAANCALSCGMFSAGVFSFVPSEYLTIINDDMARIILSSLFLGYAIPALFLLREDHE
jgi:hypothetical protein